MKQISILGCGWLGLPLAIALLKNGFKVKGSTTSESKIALLEKNGVTSFLISLFENQIHGNTAEFLKNSTVLIINIPPKLRGNLDENFVAKIRNLIPFIEKSSVQNVLFISSTAVYADENYIITEESIPNPTTESAKQLLEVEQLLLNNKNFQTAILRFGGLIGEERHPIYFLSGRKAIENPNAPINLIHQMDCIGIIEKILEQGQDNDCVWNEVYNAVAPFHPFRKEYYTQKAMDLNLSLPEFVEDIESVGKIIASDKVERVLNYKFINNLT